MRCGRVFTAWSYIATDDSDDEVAGYRSDREQPELDAADARDLAPELGRPGPSASSWSPSGPHSPGAGAQGEEASPRQASFSDPPGLRVLPLPPLRFQHWPDALCPVHMVPEGRF